MKVSRLIPYKLFQHWFSAGLYFKNNVENLYSSKFSGWFSGIFFNFSQVAWNPDLNLYKDKFKPSNFEKIIFRFQRKWTIDQWSIVPLQYRQSAQRRGVIFHYAKYF